MFLNVSAMWQEFGVHNDLHKSIVVGQHVYRATFQFKVKRNPATTKRSSTTAIDPLLKTLSPIGRCRRSRDCAFDKDSTFKFRQGFLQTGSTTNRSTSARVCVSANKHTTAVYTGRIAASTWVIIFTQHHPDWAFLKPIVGVLIAGLCSLDARLSHLPNFLQCCCRKSQCLEW